MTDDMGRLAQAVKHAYSGVECQFAKQIWLPFRRFEKIGVWATTNAGPDRLDKIFFGLLKNGVNTRKEIASRLGADRDSFVLAHLDILVREGYVRESGEEYEIAERGREFMRGDWTEERLEKEEFSCCWNDIAMRIEPAAKFSSPKDGHKIEHAEYPGEDELLNALAAHFNAGRRKQGRVFYDVDDASKPGGRIKHEEVHAEYAGLFYVSRDKGDDDGWRVDLRFRDSRIRGGEMIGKFPLCEALGKTANENEFWRAQFKKIYDEESKS